MILKETTRLELPAAADMHVHLRQGKMMELVVPQIRKGGVDTVFVMVSLCLFYFASFYRLWLTSTAQPGPSRYQCCPGAGVQGAVAGH
jgi:hypothetical protein